MKMYRFLCNVAFGSDVYVFAHDAAQANVEAEILGLVYFNGVCWGTDCECCGDAWYPVTEGSVVTEVLGVPVEDIISVQDGQSDIFFPKNEVYHPLEVECVEDRRPGNDGTVIVLRETFGYRRLALTQILNSRD